MSDPQRSLGPKEVARLAGVSTDTLRHYERKGLLPAPPRSPGGYRRYPAAAVVRVQLVQRALVVGFSLDDLARVLRERDGGGAPCARVRSIVSDRLADLDAQLEDLVALRAELTSLLDAWDARLAGTPTGKPARLLDALVERPALAPRRQKAYPRAGIPCGRTHKSARLP